MKERAGVQMQDQRALRTTSQFTRPERAAAYHGCSCLIKSVAFRTLAAAFLALISVDGTLGAYTTTAGAKAANLSSCGAGTFKASAGTEACQACPINSTSHPGSTMVTDCTCLPGYTGADGEACTACAPGSAKAANGSRACGLCEEGKYSTVSGASSCFSCPQGSLSPVGSSSLNACADCKPGFEKNVSLADSIACRACIPGKYKATNGTSACVDCPHGHFSSESGAVGCSACPSASYSPQSGASNSDVCITCSGNSFSFPGSVYPDDCALGSDVLGLYTSDECGSLDQLATAAVLFRMEHGLEGVSDKLYLFGGYFERAWNDIWYWEIATGLWNEILIGPGDPKPAARSLHSMVAIGNDLWVFGGRGSSVFNDLWRFDTDVEVERWVPVKANGNMVWPIARYSHAAVSIDDNMLIFGGEDGSGQKINEFWMFSNSTGSPRWQQLNPSSLPSARSGHGLVRSGISIFLFGGKDASNAFQNDLWEYVYDKNLESTWVLKQTANSPPPRHFHAMVALGPVILVHAGDTENKRLNDLWQYDTSDSVWINVTSDSINHMMPRFGHRMANVLGKILIHGGFADFMVGSQLQQKVVGDFWTFIPCVCLLPGTTRSTGSYSCAACHESTYKDWYGHGSCRSCPPNSVGPIGSNSKSNCLCVPGFYSDNRGDCAACAMGFFGSNGTMPCEACALGTYSSSPASSSCSNCPVGKYSEEDNGNGRASCKACPKNATSDAGSSNFSDCKCIPGYTGIDCVPCIQGTYKSEFGSAACSICPAGKYSLLLAASSESACELCPSGTDSDSLRRQCECLAGSYPVSELDRECAPCPIGNFKKSQGNFVCNETCGAHETSLLGAKSLQDCFCNTGYSRGASGQCLACEPGTFKPDAGDHKNCTKCSEGKYSESEGAAACQDCNDHNMISPAGSSDSANCQCRPGYSWGNGVCSPCLPGTYKADSGSQNCSACDEGFFAQDSAQTFCMPCPSNSSSPTGSLSRQNCSCNAGFTTENGQTCTACLAGTFKGETGSVPCTECEVGAYSSAASTTCSGCPTNSTTLSTRSTRASDCRFCKPGYTGNLSICMPCPLGTFKSSIGPSHCFPCSPGSYSNVQGSSICSLCQAGTYASDTGALSSDVCKLCPAGKSSANGTVSIEDCRCNAGYSGPNGYSSCEACLPGTFKAQTGPAACIGCPPGTYQNMTGSFSCTKCPSGKFLPSSGNRNKTSCLQCPENSISPRGTALRDNCLCGAGFANTTDGRCEACQPGFFKNEATMFSCSVCPPGSFTPNGSIANTACSLCTPGKYSNITGSQFDACIECPHHSTSTEKSSRCACEPGYFLPHSASASNSDSDSDSGSVSGSGSGSSMNTSLSYCMPCKPGTYKDKIGNESCSPCPTGSFTDSWGQINCTTCPSFSTTAGPETGQKQDCMCIAGYTGQMNFTPSCVACNPGTYKSTMGSSNCTQCGVKKYSSVVAARNESACSTCTDPFAWSPLGSSGPQDCVCDVGYYLPTGASFCMACSKGKYKSSPSNSSSCTTCPRNSTTAGERSSSLAECKCNAGHSGNPSKFMPCSQCTPGHYKHVLGTARCTPCGFGKYLSTPGATSESECIPCEDQNHWSPENSTNASACVCAIGYSLANLSVTNCRKCAPGFYKPAPGNTACIRCSAGSYSSAGSIACEVCPPDSDSSSGSDEREDCLCNKGFSGINGGPCEMCPPGTFKDTNGSDPCSLCDVGKYLNKSGSVDRIECNSCPPNSTSLPGSPDSIDCICSPGFTNESISGGNASAFLRCVQCIPGKYKVMNGSSACIDCAAGTYSIVAGSRSADMCIQCPTNSSAPAGSIHFDNCTCFSGYTLTGVRCTPCVQGTYKPNNGSGPCILCGPGTFLDYSGASLSTECIQCPIGSESAAGSGSIADCLCSAGYKGGPFSSTNSLQQVCNPCSKGHYKSINGSSECLPCEQGKYGDVGGLTECRTCPEHSQTNETGRSRITDCLCDAGYFWSGDACAACLPGTFKTSIGFNACSKCESGKYSNHSAALTPSICEDCAYGAISQEGSASQNDCICGPGYTGNGKSCNSCKAGKYKTRSGNLSCDLCPRGKYSESIGSSNASSCLSCPLNSYSYEGSRSSLNCTCNAGYSGANGQNCVECLEGKYKDWQGQGACKSCPQNANSTRAAYSITICECSPGFTGSNGSICTACQPGSFKVLRGPADCVLCHSGTYSNTAGATSADTCVPCLSNQDSLPGASILQNCTCKPGYQRIDGFCTSCPEATYKDRLGDHFCEPCPAGYTSNTGSANILKCICARGKTGPTCKNCTAGTYKEIVGSAACIQCPAGKFSRAVGAASESACQSCPLHTSSLKGSSGPENCTCDPGFITPSSGTCKVCPPGSYSEVGSEQTCKECDSGLYSTEGSTSAIECKFYPEAQGVKGRIRLYGIASVQEFLSSQTLFTTSLTNAVNQDNPELFTSDYVLITQVCDSVSCFQITTNRGSNVALVNGSWPALAPSPSGSAQVHVEFEVRTLSASGLELVASVLSEQATLQTFESNYFSAESSLHFASLSLPKPQVVSAPELSDMCGRWFSHDVPQEIRSRHSMAQSQGRLFMFGGFLEKFRNDLKQYDARAKAWLTIISDKNPFSPSPRIDAKLVNSNNSLLLFGGRDYSGNDLGDFWKLSLSTWTWTEIAAASSWPPARHSHSMSANDYEQNPDGFFLFGGNGNFRQLNDLWRWYAQNETWIQLLADENDNWPSAREGHSAASIASELFVFGGFNYADQELDDLWKYSSLNGWERIFENENAIWPSARHLHSMVAVKQSLVLFGGQSANQFLQDLWAFDQGSWSRLAENNNILNTPKPRSSFAMASLGSKVFIHGGFASGTFVGDVWEYSLCSCPAGSERIGGLCRLCPAGSFKILPGPQACIQCPSAKFSSGIGASSNVTCQACVTNAWSPSGSTLASQCLCREGYTQGNTSSCIACDTGKYKATIGTGLCMECTRGSFSESSGSSSCDLCPQGKYGVSNSSNVVETWGKDEAASCSTCPKDSNSFAGASSLFDCLCNVGYSRKNVSECEACPPGYYKDWAGEGNCSMCSSGKYSNDAATTVCISCAKGKYSGAIRATSESTCTDCPPLTDSPAGSSRIGECFCIAGATGIAGNCTKCIAGKFKATEGSSECIDCAAGSYTASDNSTLCTQCAAGKYSHAISANSSNVCTTCLRNTTSAAGSKSIAECLCVAGFFRVNEFCVECLPGKYKEAIGDDLCTICPASTFSAIGGAVNASTCLPCPARTQSPPGSNNKDDCVCIAGYELEAKFGEASSWAGSGSGGGDGTGDSGGSGSGSTRSGSCRLCPEGKYKPDGAKNCVECAKHAWSAAGSINAANCTCGPGYSGPDGHACVACETGKYKPTNGSATCTDCASGKYMESNIVGAKLESACTPCHSFSNSPPGSSSSARCLCRPGYQANTQSSCVACMAGTYKNSSGSANCTACPAHSNSPSASISSKECVCNKGYTSNSPSSCKACAAGTFKSSNGSIPCTVCEPGTYSDVEGAFESSACLECPASSTSRSGASARDLCFCKAGYTGVNGICDACSKGKYKPDEGSADCTLCSEGKYGNTLGAVSEDSCQACPLHATSEAGASNLDHCVCKTGYSKANLTAKCAICPAGKYWNKNDFDEVSCVLCPENSYGVQEGATSPSQCETCPLNTQAPAGSDALSDCLCMPGYSKVGTVDYCDACPRGKYKSPPGNQACSNCPVGKYSMATAATNEASCDPCPQNTSSYPGARGRWECWCLPGYFGGQASCKACPPGTYKPRQGSLDECTKCAIGKYSTLSAQDSEQSCIQCPNSLTTIQLGSTGIENCVCGLGLTSGKGGVGCKPCEAGTYKNISGPSNCTSCPLGKFSGAKQQISEASCQSCPQNSNTMMPKRTSLAQCLCDPGFTGDEAQNVTCSKCPVGSFKAESGTAACIACAPGSFQDNLGQTRCNLCPAGKYLDTYGRNSSDSCSMCPAFTHSLIGSPNRTSCICNQGYTGPNGLPCTACLAGYFKAMNGSEECVPCPAGSWTSTEASTECMLCAPGTYSTSIGASQASTCTSCPNFANSSQGSSSLYDCQCNPGYSGPDGSDNCTACETGFEKPARGNSSCSACMIGKYADAQGTSVCLQCPALSSTSAEQSRSIGECLCFAGYTGNLSKDAQCTPCDAGTYKMDPGPASCLACEHGKYSTVLVATNESSCVQCPDQNHVTTKNGSSSLYDCVCNKGYTWNDDNNVCEACTYATFKSNPGNQDCSKCPVGTFSEEMAAVSSDVCRGCPPNSATLGGGASSSADCKCNKGFTGNDGGPCIGCETGKFKDSNGSNPCSDCAAGSFANTTNATGCYLCVQGKYSSMVGGKSEASCQLCPVSQTSPPGSFSKTKCRCMPGYTGADGFNCSKCEAGSVKNSTGNDTCTKCAQGFYIDIEAATACIQCGTGYNTVSSGSSSISSCVCDRGHFMNSLCEPCSPGEYKDTIGNDICTACSNHSSSLAGSVRNVSCKCNKGFTGPDAGPCIPCPAGTYKGTEGSMKCSDCGSGKYSVARGLDDEAQCVECPANSMSKAASITLSACACNAGYTGSDGDCKACVAGKFKNISGSDDCTECDPGKYSESIGAISAVTCDDCPGNSYSSPGSSAIAMCDCNAGYAGSNGNCAACERGKYKGWRGQASTTAAAPTTTPNPGLGSSSGENANGDGSGSGSGPGTASTTAAPPTTTPAPPRTTPNPGSVLCALCSVGKYSTEIGAVDEAACIQCPEFATSVPGSSNLSHCVCLPGFTGDPSKDGSPCIKCPPGSYKTINGSSACLACEPGKYADLAGAAECSPCSSNSFSAIGSSSLENCTCNAGFTGFAGSCTSCQMGSYKTISGPAICSLCDAGTYSNATGQISNSTCVPCPNYTNSSAGSDDLFDCLCSPGYSGNETICLPCREGKFKSGYGDSECRECARGTYAEEMAMSRCILCPDNTYSRAGSVFLSDCICNAGYTQRIDPECTTTSSCFMEAGCVACQPGTFKGANGSAPCSLCERGKYANVSAALNASACISCPADSSSLPGSGSLDQCICNAGFTGSSGLCSPCEAGTFKSSNGSSSCTLCPEGKYSTQIKQIAESTCVKCEGPTTSPSGSQDKTNCVCKEGYYESSGTCNQCPQGKYKDTHGTENCTKCPDFEYSTSPVGSIQVSSCRCKKGYYHNIQVSDLLKCFECPSNHTSPEGSTKLSDCECGAGFTGSGDGSCIACNPGNYKSVSGTSSCIVCDEGTYSNALGMTICSNCPLHSTTLSKGSGDITDCVCKPGYTNFGGPNGEKCFPCPADTWKDGFGPQNCTICPTPSFSPPGSTNFADCQCNRTGDCFACPAGKYRGWRNSRTLCVPCAEGKYSSTVGAESPEDCLDCPSYSQSNESASSIFNCSCNKGYGIERLDENSFKCIPCPIGTYKHWVGADNCTQCPQGSTTLRTQSDTRDDCLCASGATIGDDKCILCQPGKYKDAAGSIACFDCSMGKYGTEFGASTSSACVACPNFMTSSPGSSNVLNCSCLAGFTGSNGVSCTACPNNSYKELVGPSQCLPCPENAISKESSPRRVDCLCDRGYYGENGANCTICEQGKYKDKPGSMNCSLCAPAKFSPGLGKVNETTCQECPWNATSVAGSAQILDCVCLKGFWGKNGSNCTACQKGKFKSNSGEAPHGTETDCQNCPENSWSPFASPYCRCNVGYGGPDQDGSSLECKLCEAGKYKNWRGSDECESCHERIRPPLDSSWTDPTDPLKGCDWRCNDGYYYIKDYLASDSHVFMRPVEIAEPEWFTWYELEQYQIKAPKPYYNDTKQMRRYLPNTCVVCDKTEPTANPCGYGEFWNQSNGFSCGKCDPCANTNEVKDMPNARFIFPNQYWKVAQCPYECALGYYTDTSHQTIYPKCLPCGAPHVIGICSQENEDFCQCGTGIGYLGMSPQENGDMFTEVVVWNGQCQKF